MMTEMADQKRHSAVLGFASGLLLALLPLIFRPSPASAHFGCPAAVINGTAAGETLNGDGGADASHDHADTINGNGGNDTIEGFSCNDILKGGDGNDEIHGGFNADDIHGGAGNDYDGVINQGIFLGNGNDFGIGDSGQDSLVSNSNASDTDVERGGPDSLDNVDVTDTDVRDTVHGDAGTQDDCFIDQIGANIDVVGTGCEAIFVSP